MIIAESDRFGSNTLNPIVSTRMIIAEFELEHPILAETLTSAPDAAVEWVRSDFARDTIEVLLWVTCDDLDAFEAALGDDPTVAAPDAVADLDDRRLYRVRLTAAGRRRSVYPALVEENGVVRELRASAASCECRVAFPDRESVDRFRRVCEDRGVPFELHRLFERRSDERGPGYGLTDAQRETLIGAVESGYLEIPRESSLSELADRLGVSSNAASERFRRAVRTLAEHTVYPSERDE